MPLSPQRSRTPFSVRFLFAIGLSAFFVSMDSDSAFAEEASSRPRKKGSATAGTRSARQDQGRFASVRERESRSTAASLANDSRSPTRPGRQMRGSESDPGVNRTQGPTPPRPPQTREPGSTGAATPPLPEAVTLPSGPIVAPRSNATMAPIPSREMNQADSPVIPPLPRPTAESDPNRANARPRMMRLEDFERIALNNNPSLAQAAAVVDISRGRAWQAGLWPNPDIGYQGEHVGSQKGATSTPALGEHQALFFQQEIPTANKQRISRRKFEWEAEAARWLLLAQQLRILNSVRIHFFEVLGDQKLVDDRRELYKIADAALRTTEELVNDGQANAPDLLEAQIQQQRARIALVAAENQFRQNWTNLVAEVGEKALPPTRLEGPLNADAEDLDFDATLNYIWNNNPQIKAAAAEIRRDEITVLRERVQPVPNLYVSADTGWNFIDGGVTTSYRLWGNMPLWNKNEGSIYQAQKHLQQAHANLRRLKLLYEKELAHELALYNTALTTVRTYRDESLPRAKKMYDLLLESYRRRRAAWPQVLVAQRLWFELEIEYIHALVDLRRTEVDIKGLLLVGGLQVPLNIEPLPVLNVTSQPR